MMGTFWLTKGPISATGHMTFASQLLDSDLTSDPRDRVSLHTPGVSGCFAWSIAGSPALPGPSAAGSR